MPFADDPEVMPGHWEVSWSAMSRFPFRLRGGVACFLILCFTACSPEQRSGRVEGDPQGKDAVMEEVLSYLALGDSYTIGEAVDSTERWPVQMAVRLRESGIRVADPEIVARTGWTTDELEAGIRAADPSGPFGLVSVLIGVNNQYRGRDPGEYRVQLRGLLERAVSFAGDRPERVLVLSIPDWSVMPFAEGRDVEAIAREIDDFNRIKAEESAALGIRFVNVTDISRAAAGDSSLVAEDGLHPSGTQYSRWVDRALPEVLDMLATV